VPLSWNLGALTSWNPLGHSRPVTGLLFYIYIHIYAHTHIYINNFFPPVFFLTLNKWKFVEHISLLFSPSPFETFFILLLPGLCPTRWHPLPTHPPAMLQQITQLLQETVQHLPSLLVWSSLLPDTNELEWKLKKKEHFNTQNTQTTTICCSYTQTITDGKECNKQSYNTQYMIMTWWQICKVCGRRLLTVDLNTVIRLLTQNMRVSSLMAPTLTHGARVVFPSELSAIHWPSNMRLWKVPLLF